MNAADQIFIQAFNARSQAAYHNAIVKGFATRGEQRNDGEMIALAHSELSEALDFIRHGNPPSDHIPEFNGAEEELADCIIRCMNHAAERGWRLGEAIIAKMEFNSGRPAMHGGKKF